MNFGCRFSLLILLIISLQSSIIFAVLCPTGEWETDHLDPPRAVKFHSNGMKECSTCVMYYCNAKGSQSLYVQKGGCPDDYFNDCKVRKLAVDYIRKNGSNILEYQQTGYYSGCSEYCNGTQCIKKKYLLFATDLHQNHIPEVKGIRARLSKDPEGMKDICDKSVLNTTPNLIPNGTINQNQNGSGDTSASKGQDGTMKNIGIFLIGFIFSAWIY